VVGDGIAIDGTAVAERLVETSGMLQTDRIASHVGPWSVTERSESVPETDRIASHVGPWSATERSESVPETDRIGHGNTGGLHELA
jgi:hypothetical protein